jgi:hypothetical protein
MSSAVDNVHAQVPIDDVHVSVPVPVPVMIYDVDDPQVQNDRMVPVHIVPDIVPDMVPVHIVPAAVVPPVVAEPSASLVQSLYLRVKELRKEKSLMFPIKKIHNIGIEVTIYRGKKNMYILNIQATEFSIHDNSLYETIYDYGDDATNKMTPEQFIQYIVRDTLMVLKTIKIDKLNGVFTTTEVCAKAAQLNETWVEFCQEYKDTENIVLSINECCVCFTATKTTTNCGHAVCLECISKLRIDQVADDELMRNINQRSCPMCRQRILFLI